MNRSTARKLLSITAVAVLALGAVAPTHAVIEDAELKSKVSSAIDRGLKWLRTQQKEDGSWENHPGITALALTAYWRSPRGYVEADGPFLRSGVKFLEGKAKENGAIFDRDLPVYNTAVSIMAFCSQGDPRHAPLIRKAREYLVEAQSDGGEGYVKSDKFFGGIGYGNDERPDLSNLQFALEGLAAADLDKDDPAWERAITFLQRCQNRSESNDQEWAGNDGGFVYAPGQSPAGENTSYGSMTYAGIKSFIHANLERDDPRVEAALNWIRENYTLDENPQMGAQGLYYYYQTFGKALRIVGEPVIRDAQGRDHLWADELARVLLARQNDEGFWVNTESARWWEGNKVLVTSEAILALEETLADLGPAADSCPALTRAAKSE